MNNLALDFEKLIDVNTPIIYIHDFDFARVDELIGLVLNGKRIREWNPASGTTDFLTKHELGPGKEQNLEAFLSSIYASEFEGQPETYVVLREIQDYIAEPPIKTLLQLISQRKLYDRSYNTTLIISSSVLFVPDEVKRYVSYLNVAFPSDDEIMALIREHIQANQYDETKFSDADKDAVMPSLKGLSPFEIDRMLDMAMSSNGSLSAEDKSMILKQKKSMVRSSGVLELIDSPARIEDIGGYDLLKEYLEQKAQIFDNKNFARALQFGVAVPKGVFLVGMPGCGKSLAAKAAAALFEAPLLKMDMGSMMGKYVGESEANLRKAIKIAEAAAPCILWIDEIEKAFSGIGGNNDIMTRMFGYFLSWMQEKTSPVYVMATANNADNLPPELKRKGRFDEIFCINLPNLKERASIFDVQLKKKQKHGCICEVRVGDAELDSLAKATAGFNGADIESVVNDTIEACFLDNESPVTYDRLLTAAKNTQSISKSCEKDIKKMQDVFKDSGFKNASK